MRKNTLSRKPGARAARRQFGVERLEDRLLLSTTLVTSKADDGSAGTLRSVIAASQPGDVIQFAPTVFPAGSSTSITLKGGELDVTHNLTIQGLGARQIAIDGGGTSRDFAVEAGATVSISGLTIENGNATSNNNLGGGIYNAGTINISDCQITANSADSGGAALYNTGIATLLDDTIAQNSSAQQGAGITNMGPRLSVTQCTFTGNIASATTGLHGSAIDDFAGAVLVSDSTITQNSTVGIYVNGGTSFTLNNTIIAGNGTGGQEFDFTLNPKIKGEVAVSGSNDLIGSDEYGDLGSGNGDIIIGSNAPGLAPLTNNGGQTDTMALLSSSPAIDHGSNSLVASGLLTDQRGYSRIANGTVDIGAFEFGGVPVLNPPPLVVNSIADGGDYVAGTLTLRQALTIADYQSTAQTITFDPTVFAPGSVNTITLTVGQLDIGNAANVTLQGPVHAVLTIDAAGHSRVIEVDPNTSAEIDGVAMQNGYVSGSGGGILAEGNLTLNDVSITNSTASGSSGGAISGAFGTLTLNNCTITGNTASNGGGIYSNATLNISNSTITNNQAPGGVGGGINAQGTLTLSGSTVSGNSVSKTGTTTQSGGGLYSTGTAIINDSTLSGNSADGGAGGGIFTAGDSLTLTNSTIAGNTAAGASGKGGGIYNAGFDFLTVTNSTLAYNAAGNGGGLYLARGDASFYNVIAAQNTASVAAGKTDVFGTLDSQGPTQTASSSNDLIDDATSAGGLLDGTSGNVIGHNAMLGTLADNGGPTQTILPLSGSPAIDAGDNTLANDYSGPSPVALTTDQRGALRIYNGTVDIGAIEVQPANLQATAGADQVQLTWSGIPGATSYIVSRGASPGGETVLATVSAPNYLDTAVIAGTQYFYTVSSVTGGVATPVGNEESATPFLPVVNANPAGDTITLSPDADGLHVDWTINGGGKGQVLIADPIGLTVNGQGGTDAIVLASSTPASLPGLLNLNSGAGSFTLEGLPASGDPLANHSIDLGRSTLYVTYIGSSPEQMLRQYLKNGYGTGDPWSGRVDAITTSAGTADYGIGYGDYSSPLVPGLSIELKYTIFGDANLDGTVNLADFLSLARNFGANNATWAMGDMNYDGAVNLSDLLILVRHFGKSVPAFTAAASSLSTSSATDLRTRRSVR